jgi:hypothetical protein
MNSLAADGCIQKHAQTAQLVDDTYNEQYIFDVVNDLRDKSLYRWSDNPRLFLIFRDIGQIREPDKPQLLDDFIKSGISDIWLPIASHELLQEVLPPGLHDQFLKAQRRVCSQPTQLQAGLGNLHRNFATKDGAPFKQRRSIGRGRLGHVEEVQGASDGRLYARKSIRKSSYINTARNDILRFYCELKTLHRINHRHCVQIVRNLTSFMQVYSAAFILRSCMESNCLSLARSCTNSSAKINSSHPRLAATQTRSILRLLCCQSRIST